MASHWIDLPSFDGKTFAGDLAPPPPTPRREPAPGLGVLQEIWSVNAHIGAAADHGFNYLARPSDHQQSAALAHGRALTFLASHLGRHDT